MTQQIQPHSKASQIAAFFAANRHEYLTWDDLIVKFDLGDKAKAREIVACLKKKRGIELECVSVLRLKGSEA